jgi:ankyrin repeat protein
VAAPGGYSHGAMRRLTPLLVLAGTLLAAPALAQGVGRNAPLPNAPSAGRPPPPALPGLAARRAVEPIPAETPGANLPPSAALFDAINRGDLGAAREAMARGADLNARNQLGLTPVDAAVDQGRNEIVFYLLSARGPSGKRAAEGASRLPPVPGRPRLRPSPRRLRRRGAAVAALAPAAAWTPPPPPACRRNPPAWKPAACRRMSARAASPAR